MINLWDFAIFWIYHQSLTNYVFTIQNTSTNCLQNTTLTTNVYCNVFTKPSKLQYYEITFQDKSAYHLHMSNINMPI